MTRPQTYRVLAKRVAILMLGTFLIGADCEPTEVPLPTSSGDIIIQAFPDDNAFSPYFSQFTTVFGVYIFATETVPDAKLRHATALMAEYLDNDEDGAPDDSRVTAAMSEARSVLVMFGTENEASESGVWGDPATSTISGQDLYATETNPPQGFDAALEEVLHLITNYGYAGVWPDVFGTNGETELTLAMDIARGGHFTTVPSTYPEEAWYHYDDRTCVYPCQATEYVYWALTTALGAQADPERCDDIAQEWEPCTRDLLEETDLAVVEILYDRRYSLPTVLPDGIYQP